MPTSGDSDTDLLDWLRELADEIVMDDDSLSETDLTTWPATVEFVAQHIGDQDRPKLELASQELRRLGHLL